MNMFDVYPVYDIDLQRAEGAWIWDTQGTKYLDMYGGHAVISIGHTHPHYVKTITEQLNRIGFYSNSVIIGLQQELADRIGKLSGKEDYALFLCNSGAEANENALKLASFHTGRKKVIAFKGSFHGRTSLAVAATDNPNIVAPVNETENVLFLPLNDESALEETFAQYPDQIAAVIVEGIQGVAGIIPAHENFLRTIRTLCDRYGAVYVADAVQCGCGRTGTYYSHNWAGVDADIYSMAKGIGNGFPIGAIAIAPKFTPKYGMLGTTFGGNHLACAAAIAVAEVMQQENLMENAARMGDYLIQELQKIPQAKQVRGKGLMIGIELPYESAALRKKMLLQEHIFVSGSGNKNTVRILPPLNLTKEQADIFLKAFHKLLAEPAD
ncbi:MAG: aminotransferase class III-fold pyridoxal phosphate-dependent enzyme [Rikenellaceae bacterium]|nr:aminotransferase class III-fold pyridoxal phosphate-dependent enzyme [Rikenellaceae bacterium]